MDCRYERAAAVLAVGCCSFSHVPPDIPQASILERMRDFQVSGWPGVSMPGLGDLESLQPRLQMGFVSKWVMRGLRKLRGRSPILDLIGG